VYILLMMLTLQKTIQMSHEEDVKIIDGKLVHTKDGGIVEEYTQNPPAHKYLYGCIICGSYFETDIRQDA